jgi:hypothetical protein
MSPSMRAVVPRRWLTLLEILPVIIFMTIL